MARRPRSTPAPARPGPRALALALACWGAAGCEAAPAAPGGAAPALARVTGEGAGWREADAPGPRGAGKAAQAGALPRSSPGSVPCAEDLACPVSKAGRTVCCHAPNARPVCRDGAKCGRGSGYRYSANLACDETADCAGAEPGKDVVCCLSDDGEKPPGGAEAPYNRGACVPRAACAAPSTLACSSDAECGGKRCRPLTLGAGLTSAARRWGALPAAAPRSGAAPARAGGEMVFAGGGAEYGCGRMVAINPLAREVTFKVVFYGPGLGGKTTSLQIVHDKARPEQRGKMVSLATPIDRTLYFDYLPYRVGPVRGMGVRLQLFTVPGQVHFNATRKLVLNGADGVVFVADSQSLRSDANLESFENLRDNLLEQRRELDAVPLVFQYNKRDLPDVLPVDELERLLNAQGAPAVPTVAVRGQGVFETLDLITNKVLEAFERRPVRALSPPPSPIAPSGGGLAEALQALGAEDRGGDRDRGERDGGGREGGGRYEGGREGGGREGGERYEGGQAAPEGIGGAFGGQGGGERGEGRQAAPEDAGGPFGGRGGGERDEGLQVAPEGVAGAFGTRGSGEHDEGRQGASEGHDEALGGPGGHHEAPGRRGDADEASGGPGGVDEASSGRGGAAAAEGRAVNDAGATQAAGGERRGRVPPLGPAGDDDDTMEPSRAAAILLGMPLPEEPAPPSDPLLEIDEVGEAIDVAPLERDDERDGPPTAAFPPLAASSAPERLDVTTLAPASFSFAGLWPRRERDAVLAAEGAMAAGDGRRAIELLDGLASRTTLAAVSLVGASDTGAAATAFAPLLLGVNGPRYAAFRAMVRQARAGLSPEPRQVLAAYALVIELAVAKEQLIVSQGGTKPE